MEIMVSMDLYTSEKCKKTTKAQNGYIGHIER